MIIYRKMMSEKRQFQKKKKTIGFHLYNIFKSKNYRKENTSMIAMGSGVCGEFNNKEFLKTT